MYKGKPVSKRHYTSFVLHSADLPYADKLPLLHSTHYNAFQQNIRRHTQLLCASLVKTCASPIFEDEKCFNDSVRSSMQMIVFLKPYCATLHLIKKTKKHASLQRAGLSPLCWEWDITLTLTTTLTTFGPIFQVVYFENPLQKKACLVLVVH